jgi:hypothetical protein
MLRFPQCIDNRLTDGGKVVSLTHRPCSTPRNIIFLLPVFVKWSEFLATDPEVRVRFPALPDFLSSSGSGTGSAQTRGYN